MLEHGESSIFAYFWDRINAHRAKDELESMGYEHVQLDAVTNYGTHHDDDFFQPTLVDDQDSAIYSWETATYGAILLSSTPETVMIGDHFYGGLAFLVTVVTDNNSIFQAEEVLKRYGGVFFGYEAGLHSRDVGNAQGGYEQNAIY